MAQLLRLDDDASRVPLTVRLVGIGDGYGYADQHRYNNADARIEFYDATHPGHGVETDRGQFVAAYYLSTLNRHPDGRGLVLHNSRPDLYTVSAADLALVCAWANLADVLGAQLVG